MVAKGKGLLAADESSSTIKKRFDSIKLESTEENRRTYRDMLFTAPRAPQQWISGVILYDETIRQKTTDGVPFPEYLTKHRHHSGHQGRHGRQAPGRLPRRDHHRGAGWPARAAVRSTTQLGRALRQVARGDRHRRRAFRRASAIEANAHALARYAALCQEQHIVPIVEPEVLMDGAHTIERCEEVTDAGARGGVRAAVSSRAFIWKA